jgi:hypothetical protein
MAGHAMMSGSRWRWLAVGVSVAGVPFGVNGLAQVTDTTAPPLRADLAPSPTAPRGKPGDAGRPIAGNPLWSISLKELSNTRERPIFSPSRRGPPTVAERPYVPPPPPPRIEAKPPEPLMLSLVGTIAGEGESVGLFMEKKTQEVVRLRIGEAHEGWVLRAVQGRTAMLEKGDRKETVALPAPGGGEAVNDMPRMQQSPPPPPQGVRRSRE